MDNKTAAKDAVNTILGLCITFPVLAVLAVAGRFYARRLKHIPPAADDWLILLAVVCRTWHINHEKDYSHKRYRSVSLEREQLV